VLGISAGAPRLAGRVGARPTPAAADISEREARRTMQWLFSGQTTSALAHVDSLAAYHGGEPLFHLLRARLYRERLPVDDEKKDDVSALAGPLYDDLDHVIATCSERIEAGDDDPRLRLYRGWAFMFASHVRTFERSFWPAGRLAKKGKQDLEWYLEREPSDPVANSIMGAFLYFADTLPAAYKFLSKLLFLPGGDRDRGLEMMELARGWNSLVEVDNNLILYSVYLGFEGHYEDGLYGFASLRRDYPDHATFLRPDAIMLPLIPLHAPEDEIALDDSVQRIALLHGGEVDWTTLTLIRFMRAYDDRFYHPRRAESRFEKIIEEAPEHPDWVAGYARFELGRMAAARGEFERARALFLEVTEEPRWEYLHGEARGMVEVVARGERADGLGPEGSWKIYARDAEAVARIVSDVRGKEEPSAADLFYLGEALLAQGAVDEALAAYERALAAGAARWDEAFLMVAAARAGEIHGLHGAYAAAEERYREAARYWHKEFLYDWVLEGRRRYYERLRDGKETIEPTLLAVRLAP
jgi:tetratricopeptide (TPR) repeat protein